MSAVEQKNVFDTALADTLEKDCSYDVVQSVHEQLRGRIQEHKESRDPAPLDPKILSELSTVRAPKTVYQYLFASKRKKTSAKTFLKKKGLAMR